MLGVWLRPLDNGSGCERGAAASRSQPDPQTLGVPS